MTHARAKSRLTIRWRLTLTYGALVTASGTILIVTVWAYMGLVPQYSSTTISSSDLPHDTGARPTPLPEQNATVPADLATSGATVTSASEFLNQLLATSLIVLLFVAGVSTIVGWLVAGRVLRPLKAVNHAATLAATGALDHRVHLAGPHDEIRDLADTFNHMLAGLDQSFNTHKRFAANASHELHTPLTTIQTMIDVTLADPTASTPVLRELAQRIRTVNRRNSDTVTALLDLAEIGQHPIPNHDIDVYELILDAIHAVTPEANARNITITDRSHPDTSVHGDRRLLRQALTNLMQNAVRHNHPSGTIDISTASNQDCTKITISNTGATVPPGTSESLTEPFVRGAARTITPGAGHGLGLAIVASIAAAHGGHLRLRPNAGGGLTTTITVRKTLNPRTEAS